MVHILVYVTKALVLVLIFTIKDEVMVALITIWNEVLNIADQYIVWFDVTVDHPRLMQLLKYLDKFQTEPQYIRLFKVGLWCL